jgi:hypothetical protein
MRGLLDGFRTGYRETKAVLGPQRWPPRPPLDRQGPPEPRDDAEPPPAPVNDRGDASARVVELEAALKESHATLAELADLAEQMKTEGEQLRARIAELEAAGVAAEVGNLATEVLSLPGAETLLRNKYHPDKHPKADETERRAFNEATQKINAAYAELKRRKRSAME